MSELGDTFKAFKEANQAKRQSNREQSIALLQARKIPYEVLSPYHLRVGGYDFWPSTGLWINCENKRSKGRGVMGLLIKLEKGKSR